jgi:DNA polymerase
MFKVPVESITKGNPLRQKGKISELALGYQGGKGALITMGALDMGLDEDELPGLVSAWRASNPNIVNFWYEVEAAAIRAVKNKTAVRLHHGIEFSYSSGMLFLKLPSGRKLAYVRPKIEMEEKFNKEGITYEGLDQETKKWGRLKTYGGKLVENIVQATARDCLAVSMLRLDEAGYEINMHVHDEVILTVPKNNEDHLKKASEIMGRPISWAAGLPLRADAFETEFYKKD